LQRLKYVGMLHRGKRTPGQFMLRLKVPNGIVNSDQMRFYADSVERYGEGGVLDITTRQNIQLRGVRIEDAPDIIDGLHARNQTSFQSALDSVRNVVGNPLAGIDDQELVDTRMFSNAINDLISLDPITETRGNPMWANRKLMSMCELRVRNGMLSRIFVIQSSQCPVNSTLPSVAPVMTTHILI
jgi:ferredoxin-nitrite reductase